MPVKILTSDKVREADAYTIKNEPIKSIDLMERAATACVPWFEQHIDKNIPVNFLIGPGNNGGDGLVIARKLQSQEYKISVFLLKFTDKMSDDCSINLKRLKIDIVEIESDKDFNHFDTVGIWVDAVFGSGLDRNVTGFVADAFKELNSKNHLKVAIDIPSGLFADKHTDPDETVVLRADYTLSLELPKYAFMHAENHQYVGSWQVIPFGLHQKFMNEVDTDNYFLNYDDAVNLLKLRSKFSHKGTYGHALLIAGSKNKGGAAVLAARASLRSGVGLMTCHTVAQNAAPIISAVPECMLSTDSNAEIISELPKLNPFDAVGIGPGVGTDEDTAKTLKRLIQDSTQSLVLDADALNILSDNKTWLSFLPPESILTPHPKEFERLTEEADNDFHRLELARDFAFKYKCWLVLKGAHTAIVSPNRKIIFNSSGNPGMATAGSGDTLTGIILGLVAQSYSPQEACLLGVYIHGLAADIYAAENGLDAMMASDICESLPKAFKMLEEQKA